MKIGSIQEALDTALGRPFLLSRVIRVTCELGKLSLCILTSPRASASAGPGDSLQICILMSSQAMLTLQVHLKAAALGGGCHHSLGLPLRSFQTC